MLFDKETIVLPVFQQDFPEPVFQCRIDSCVPNVFVAPSPVIFLDRKAKVFSFFRTPRAGTHFSVRPNMVFGQKVTVFTAGFHVYSSEMCCPTSVTRTSPDTSFGSSARGDSCPWTIVLPRLSSQARMASSTTVSVRVVIGIFFYVVQGTCSTSSLYPCPCFNRFIY